MSSRKIERKGYDRSSGKIIDNEIAFGHDWGRKTSLRARQGFARYNIIFSLPQPMGTMLWEAKDSEKPNTHEMTHFEGPATHCLALRAHNAMQY